MSEPATTCATSSAKFADPGASETERWAELLTASGRGDDISFELLAREVHGLLRAQARRVLPNSDDAEEVVQETLLSAWRNAHRYDPQRGRAITWLSQIVRQRAIDLIRRTTARRARENRVIVRSCLVDIDDTVETVLILADQNIVRSALPCLTSLQREAISLVYYGGMGTREAAERLGVPVPTMRTRLRDGLRRLRHACDDLNPSPDGD